MRPEGLAIPACLLHVFESFGCGGFLLDRERQLLFLNPTGVDCLGDGLMMRGKRVAATDRESDMRLQSLIEAALNATEDAHGSASVWVRRDSRLPLVVHVVRLQENVQPVLRGASVLLVVFDPECCQPPPPGMLIDLFGLTPAEASVAIGIVDGRHLIEIAVDRGVKVGTVRTYSKRVFSETRTRSQAELAALLTRLAFPIARRCDGRQTPSSVYVISTDRDDLRKRIGRSG
jgi:DNA-binding CsgD family transcriptional regulator